MDSDIVPLAQGGIVLITISVLVTFWATIWTGLRFYARHLRKLRPQLEDYVILPALLMLYVEVGFIIAMTLLGGIGHHMWELQPKHITQMFKLSYGMQFSYAIGLGLVKCSLCLTLARIFFLRPYQIAASIAAGLSVAWTFVVILNGLLVCRPISMFWDPTTPGGRCGDMNAAFAAVGIVDVSVDVVILVIPLPMLLRLQMPVANRIAVGGIFTLGIITIIVGSLRTVKIIKMNFADASYSGMVPDLLTVLELAVAIIVSSSAILRPVFDRMFQTLSSVTNSNQRSTQQSRTRGQLDDFGDWQSPNHRPRRQWPSEVSFDAMEDERIDFQGEVQMTDDRSSDKYTINLNEAGPTMVKYEQTHPTEFQKPSTRSASSSALQSSASQFHAF